MIIKHKLQKLRSFEIISFQNFQFFIGVTAPKNTQQLIEIEMQRLAICHQLEIKLNEIQNGQFGQNGQGGVTGTGGLVQDLGKLLMK